MLGYSASGDASFDSSSMPLTVGYITSNNNRAKVSFQTITAKFDNGSKEKFSGVDFDFDWTIESIEK